MIGHEINRDSEYPPEPFRSMVAQMASVPVDEALSGQARREALAAGRWPY